MWDVPKNNILAKTTKPELAQYLREARFIITIASLLKAIKPGFLKTLPGLTENLIENYIKTQ